MRLGLLKSIRPHHVKPRRQNTSADPDANIQTPANRGLRNRGLGKVLEDHGKSLEGIRKTLQNPRSLRFPVSLLNSPKRVLNAIQYVCLISKDAP